jgi:hypothetical protein
MVAPVLTIGTLSLATLALHVRDPHQHGSWGLCPMYAATGIYCPGCGGLRAVNDLTNGHIGAAFSSNVVFTALMPLAVFALALWAVDRWRGKERHVDMRRATSVAYAFLAVLLVFTVVRNLPFGAWLAP